ncbi:carboxylesterase [Malonomonas rubra DSM 5091]|uniref:Carboxylesterase n=1 Tax=Malonomonas rubra DSM 5091 TaxID=1122189 RepID=A0A1M6IA23_MALRU|nr:alpha/beta fold hydrolase [Malonomonas rubra]SHJ31267.1 carboxylesterase [Malonomonas rubra DSM 5091]
MKISIEQEITLAQQEGVTHPHNLPYLRMPACEAKQAVLLVHGFGSTPWEMNSLAEHLLARGAAVFAVRLPGHGTSAEDLATRTAEEWLATTIRGYKLLQQLQLPLSAAGLSTGCLLILLLAHRYKLHSMVLLAPYLRLKHRLSPFARQLAPFIRYQKRVISPQDQPYYYEKRPLKGVVQLNRLRKQVTPLLPEIITPALILSSEGDRTVAPGTGKEIFDRLGSENKTYHCYGPEAPHVLTSPENPFREDVLQRSASFLLSS